MSSKVRFDILTDKQYRPVDGDFIIRLALRMGISELAETLPLNLCLLIDTSYSMGGAKLEQAKASACELISALRDDDCFSVIAFSTRPQELASHGPMTAERREQAVTAINEIVARGVTRLDLAMDHAYAALEEGGDEFMNALLCLSDGAPTSDQGEILNDEEMQVINQRVSQARGAGVTTSTVGLGDADQCLAPWLETCSEQGGGVFYHAENPAKLKQQFQEEFNRLGSVAVSDAAFKVSDVNGQVRKAVAVYPDLRELPLPNPEDDSWIIPAGALQKGEEHVFLVEVVTPGGEANQKQPICSVQANYAIEGSNHEARVAPPLLEYTAEDSLLDKPGHPDVEKYKGMYTAFVQTQKAAANIRSGGDPKKTRVLLAGAAKTTRRLGLSKQTKLLNDMAASVESGEIVSENQLAEVAVASRKTKVLAK